MNTSIKFLSISIVLAFLLSSCGKVTQETQPIRKDITEMVFASGKLQPQWQYQLTAQTDGYLINFQLEEGDIISAGQLIAQIDNPNNVDNNAGAYERLDIARENARDNAPIFLQMEANIEAAKQKVAQDKKQVERYEKLLASNSIAKIEYENVVLALNNSEANLAALEQQYRSQKELAEQQVRTQTIQTRSTSIGKSFNTINAPVGGKVYQKMKEAGDFVRRGEVVAVIGSTQPLIAQLNIDENNIAQVKHRQEVLIQLNVHEEKSYKATIADIKPSFDEQSQSFICEAVFLDSLDFQISGTQLQANILIGEKENTLVIPRNYLDYGNTVQVKNEKKPIAVKTGFISNEWVEIVEGLDDSSIIITENIHE